MIDGLFETAYQGEEALSKALGVDGSPVSFTTSGAIAKTMKGVIAL
jgi:hypothetical protein